MPQEPTSQPYDPEVMKKLGQFSRAARTGSTSDQPESQEAAQMRRNRAINHKTASGTAGGGANGSMQFATGRPRDPLFYWKQNNLPYDFGESDELKRIRTYCNTPDAPILMADGTFKPIGEVAEGDEVIGWIWEDGGKRPRTDGSVGRRKRVVSTKVLATSRRQAPMVIETTMESGQVIKCTPDHLWSNYGYSPATLPQDGKTRCEEYRTLFPSGGRGGVQVSRLAMPVEPLTDPKMVEAAGYLAGMIDADGCVDGGAIGIGQSRAVNPDICARIEECLNVLGLEYRVSDRDVASMRWWHLRSTLQNRLRRRAWMPLSVKVEKAWNNCIDATWTGSKDRPASSVDLGPGEVVSMQTETGNYIAWGLGSKNCRLLYSSHPIIGSCVDIYSKYPLLGVSMECKDSQLEDFYNNLFFDEQGLNYEDFFVDIGREFWSVGEAFPFGSFNESLGIWEDDELLNPDDVEVERSPFLKDPRFFIKLPQTLREIIEKRSPAWEYAKLMEAYPELARYTSQDAMMPVSSVLLRHMKFKGDTFNKRGVPLLMRSMRAVMQEEMLNSAMDAIADRLYTPLLLVKLGASATDLGTEVPWIPTPDDLEDFNQSLDMAMAGDFRVLTHHFGISMESVFGRENMPDFGADFDRLEARILQTFGLSQTMISGASSGETYAADALNKDVVSQLLTKYQKMIAGHFRQRALVVAEAQEHYDYDERGGKRYVKMEEILEIDEETGEERIIEQPKLLVPDLKFQTMSLSDKESERQFMEQLHAGGVPVSIKTRMMNIPFEFDQEIERVQDEQVQLAVAEQETRKAQFLALRAAGLPIPDSLRQDFEPKANTTATSAEESSRTPVLGLDPTVLTPNIAPSPDDLAADQTQGVPFAGQPTMAVDPAQDPAAMAGAPNPDQAGQYADVPPESNEQRADMPKASQLWRQSSRMREISKQHYLAPEALAPIKEGQSVEPPADKLPRGKFAAPSHIGMRRHATHVTQVLKNIPMEKWNEAPLDEGAPEDSQ